MRSSRLPGIKTLDDFDASRDQPRHCRGSERAQSLLRRSGRPHHLARRSQDHRPAGTPPQDPHLSFAPGHRRDRLPAGQSLPYRQHPRQQLPDAQAHRPLQDPPLASCGVEPFTPEEKESKSKGENDELEARHLRQVCNFRWPDLCSLRPSASRESRFCQSTPVRPEGPHLVEYGAVRLPMQTPVAPLTPDVSRL